MPNQRNPVFSVYLEKYLVNGEVVNGPDLVMTVPTSDPRSVWMVNPSYKAEMGKAESFDFSINPKAPYYNAFIQMQTRMRIFYDDRVIFYGRITTVNTSSLLQVRAIHAEGIYAVLRDTTQLGLEEELQAKTTAAEQFGNIISAHNSQLGSDTWKHVSVGVIDSSGLSRDMNFSKAKKRGSTSCATTISAIDGLIGNHGGYTRMRYELANQNDKASAIDSRLDWLKDYFYDATEHGASRPHIQIAKNLIDFSSSSELGEIFTRVIPIGHKASSGSSSSSSSSDSGSSSSSTKKKTTDYIYLSPNYIKVSDICGVYSDAVLNSGFHRKSDYQNAENNYGVIYKSVNFQNAYNAELLREYANDWIKNNYFGGIRSFSVKAVDMHMVDPDGPAIFVGDVVDFTYPEYDSNGDTILITRKLVCKSVQMNLFAPDQNSYTLGIPSDTLDFEYGEKKKKTGKASTTIANNASVGGGSPPPKKVVDFASVKNYLLWFYYSAPWGTYNASVTNHAYSWRCDGLTGRKDQQPYNTVKNFRNVKVTNGEEEEIPYNEYYTLPSSQTRAEDVIENGQRVTKYYYTPKTEDVSYMYANFNYNGTNLGECRIVAHYYTSPCRALKNDTSIPLDVRQKIPVWHLGAFHYGVAVKEGTLDIFAFDWNDYLAGDASISVDFYFPEYPGGNYKSSFEGGDSSDEKGAPEAGGPEVDEDKKTLVYLDDNGDPVASIFTDFSSMKFSDAYDPDNWEMPNGEIVPPNTQGAHPRPLYDDEGNRIWTIAINEPIQMLNPNWYEGAPSSIEKYITLGKKGSITTNDISLPGIPSFQTEVAVIHDAIIQRATVGELRAYVAELGNYQDVDDVDITKLLDEEHVYHYEFPPGTIVSKDTPGAVKVYDHDAQGNLIPLKDKDGKSVWKVKDGTRFKTAQDHIQGVTGRFTLNSDGSMDIIEGGGINIKRNNAQFGLWDKGELAAGIFAYRDPNDGSKITEVRGDKVWIGYNFNSELTEEDLNSWAQSAADGGGVFAKYLTVKQLTAEQIDTMFLNSEFNNLTYLNVGNPHNKPVRIEEGLDVGFIETYYPPKVQALGGTFYEYRVLNVEKDQNDENTLIITKMDDAGNIETINFKKAASGGAITASWSGSSPRNNLIIADESHAHEYVINFGNSRQISGKTINDIIEVINIDDNGDEYENTVSTASYSNGKYLVVPYRIVKTTPSTGAEDDSYTTIFNGVLGAVNATPVYNNGWNAASDITALNPVIISSQTTKDFRLVKPKKNDPGTSQTIGYHVDVDINYAYVKDPNDSVIAKVDNTAADRNRSSRIGNNVPNYYNVSDDEYDNAPNDHKFALTRYGSRYSVVTQYQKRDGTYANGDIYYITTPADNSSSGGISVSDIYGVRFDDNRNNVNGRYWNVRFIDSSGNYIKIRDSSTDPYVLHYNGNTSNASGLDMGVNGRAPSYTPSTSSAIDETINAYVSTIHVDKVPMRTPSISVVGSQSVNSGGYSSFISGATRIFSSYSLASGNAYKFSVSGTGITQKYYYFRIG